LEAICRLAWLMRAPLSGAAPVKVIPTAHGNTPQRIVLRPLRSRPAGIPVGRLAGAE
jgi:hypothetical protein